MSKDHEASNVSEEVTLKMKLEDVLGAVSKTNGGPVTTGSSIQDAEGVELRKAWFRHVLSSVEKLNYLVETIRSVDLSNLKVDLKDEIRKVEYRLERLEQLVRDNRQEVLSNIDKVDTELTRKVENSYQELLKRIEDVNRDLQSYKTIVDSKFNQAQKEFLAYKKEVVDPLRMKILTISVKLGVWATLAGVVGSTLFTIGWYLLKTHFTK
jgi:hypothetical protein